MDADRKRVMLGMASGFLLGLLCTIVLAAMLVVIWMHHVFILGITRPWLFVACLAVSALGIAVTLGLAVGALRKESWIAGVAFGEAASTS